MVLGQLDFHAVSCQLNNHVMKILALQISLLLFRLFFLFHSYHSILHADWAPLTVMTWLCKTISNFVAFTINYVNCLDQLQLDEIMLDTCNSVEQKLSNMYIQIYIYKICGPICKKIWYNLWEIRKSKQFFWIIFLYSLATSTNICLCQVEWSFYLAFWQFVKHFTVVYHWTKAIIWIGNPIS